MSVLMGYYSIAQTQTGPKQCPLYGVAGCQQLRGFQCIEISELSFISWVFAVEGCPLSGVPL